MKLLGFLFLILEFSSLSHGLFWGKPDYSKARKLLAEIRVYRTSGDCQSVVEKYEEFLMEKPPLDIKKEAYLFAGECYEKENAMEKAISIYKLASELYPADPVFFRKASSLYLENGFYQSALELLLKLEKKYPYDEKNWLPLARAWRGLGFLRKAVPYYRKAAAIDLRNYSLLMEYCLALKEGSFFTEGYGLALKGYEYSGNIEFALLAAEISALSGSLQNSISLLRGLENKGLCSLKCEKMLVVYSFFSGDLLAASDRLEKLKEDPDFHFFIEGLIYWRNGEKNRAFSSFSKSALSKDPFLKKASENFLKEAKK
ncbi:MAG: hypothetical protein Fur0012_11330 [Elusimicrobiota bacterium]